MPATNRVLVIVAHPDDEVLGCGGTVARLVAEGHEVHFAILGEGMTSRHAQRSDADLKQFEEFVRGQPLVRECWMLSGEIDFILKCVAPDLKTFQSFVTELTAAPHVRNVKTSLTLRNSKDAALVPMEDLGRR